MKMRAQASVVVNRECGCFSCFFEVFAFFFVRARVAFLSSILQKKSGCCCCCGGGGGVLLLCCGGV